jgi:hypothetical protein
MHVRVRAAGLQQAKDQWRRDVVGQVADDAQRVTGSGEGAEVEAQCIRAVQREARVDAEGGEQGRGEVPVQLDRVEAAAAGQQRLRERTEAGPISTRWSSAAGAMAAAMRSMIASSRRKFWPKRLRGWWRGGVGAFDMGP